MNDLLIQDIYAQLDFLLQKPKIEKKCLCNKTYKECKLENNIYITNDKYIGCYDCGYIFDIDNIDLSAEWNNYTDDNNISNSQSKIRCGNPETADCFGNTYLKTYMKSNSKFSQFAEYKLFKTLYKLNVYSNQNPIEKKHKDLYDILKSANNTLNLDESILHYIADEYIKLNDIYRCKKRIGIIAALLYIYLKNNNIIKTINTISIAFNIDEYIITTSINYLSSRYSNNIKNTISKNRLIETINKANHILNIDNNTINNIINNFTSTNDNYLYSLASYIYIYLKNNECIKSYNTIAHAFNIDKFLLMQYINNYEEDNKQIIDKDTSKGTSFQISSNEYSYLESFSFYLNMKKTDINLMKKIYIAINNLNLFMSNPQSLASSIIHFYNIKTKKEISLEQICNISNISDISIKKFTNLILKNEQLIFNYIKQNKITIQ